MGSTTRRPCGGENEENPFHTEVGYWLWDGATGEIVRGLRRATGHRRAGRRHRVVRGEVVHAGGQPPATPHYAIGENQYLGENASTLSYSVTITVNDDGTWSYDETTMLKMTEFDDPFAHTDHNTLRKVG